MRQGARDRPLNPVIRFATTEDLDALANLEKICFKEETFHRKQLRYLLLRARSIVMIAEFNGKIAGSMIILLRNSISNARIYSLNVHPGYRRMGVASKLMDTALEIMQDKGYKKLTLEVGINNQAAQNLYMSKGFIVDRILYTYYKNGENALHLSRRLMDQEKEL